MNQTRLANAKRLVVKVGSALVTNNGAGLDLAAIDDWARQIAVLRAQGQGSRAGFLGRHRRRHAAPGLGQAPEIGP